LLSNYAMKFARRMHAKHLVLEKCNVIFVINSVKITLSGSAYLQTSKTEGARKSISAMTSHTKDDNGHIDGTDITFL